MLLVNIEQLCQWLPWLVISWQNTIRASFPVNIAYIGLLAFLLALMLVWIDKSGVIIRGLLLYWENNPSVVAVKTAEDSFS